MEKGNYLNMQSKLFEIKNTQKYVKIILILTLLCYSSAHADWQEQVVIEDSRLAEVVFTLDSNDQPHVAYQVGETSESGQNFLYYYATNSESWSSELIDIYPVGLSYINLAVDMFNSPHFVFSSTAGGNPPDSVLEYYSKSSVGWNSEIISNESIFKPAIAIDNENSPAIIYSIMGLDGGQWDGTYSFYSANKKTLWQPEKIYESYGFADFNQKSLSLVFDYYNNPRVLFSMDLLGETLSDSSAGIHYLTKDTLWKHELIDKITGEEGCTVTNVSNLVLDSNGNPWIAYVENGVLFLAYKTFFGWKTRIVENINSGYFILSLSLDSLDRPHLLYSTWDSGNNSKTIYAFYDNSWNFEIVEPTLTKCFLQLDKNDQPHIVYLNHSDQIIYKYHTGNNTVPTINRLWPGLLYVGNETLMTIQGKNFSEDVTVKLLNNGEEDVLAEVIDRDNETIQCIIPPAGISGGTWNVVVENSDGAYSVLHEGAVFLESPCIIEQFVSDKKLLNLLRVVRDSILLKTDMGRKFVEAYYSYSEQLLGN